MDNFLPETARDPAALIRQMFEEDDEEEDDQLERRRREKVLFSQMELVLLLLESDSPQQMLKRDWTRSCKKDTNILQGIDKDRKDFALTPKTSFWYGYYVLNRGDLNENGLQMFRIRFQLPYKKYLELLQELEVSG